jgi:hypothetical protein
MAALWFSLLGLGTLMSGTAIWLAWRDRRRSFSTPELPDETPELPDEPGPHHDGDTPLPGPR